MSIRLLIGSLVICLLTVACATDPTASDEYLELSAELAALTTERDALLDQMDAEISAAGARVSKVAATVGRTAELIADPDAYGSEEEVLDELASLATADAVMDDVAFGSVGIRQAWANTLFGSDAVIETYATWMSEDGSLGGSLWVWRGTASNGEPFELIGVNTDRYDAEGLLEYELVEWPYDHDFVRESIRTGN